MSNNEVAVRHGSGLDITPEQDVFSDRQLAALRQLGVQDASNADLAVFMHVAQRTGLDPFARQIYMIKRAGKQTIQTGIDGFRLVARRAADRAGQSIAYEDTLWADAQGTWTTVWLENGPPQAAKLTVLRNGKPFQGVAHYREYVQTKDGRPTQMWADKPALMLAKCAEALALRKAFPQDLAGLHTADEYRDDPPLQAPRRVTAAEIRREPDPEPDPHNHLWVGTSNACQTCGASRPDPVTGEVQTDQPTEWPDVAPIGEEKT